MVVEVTDTSTGQSRRAEIDDESFARLKDMESPVLTAREAQAMLDNLPVSAELKACLGQLREFSLRLGKSVIDVGKRLFEMLLVFIKNYPSTAKGVLIGLVIGVICDMIPIVGWLVGPWLAALLGTLGAAVGYWRDSRHSKLVDDVSAAASEHMGPLQSISI